MNNQTHIHQIVEDLSDTWVAIRRHLHQFPELSGEERRTSALVADALQHFGLDVTLGIGGYGVSAMLHGDQPGPTVAYRADMDALPIQDTCKMPYAPFELGLKHACGHDVHVAVALGAAEVLASLRGELRGTVQFIFQPAEESLDGAQAMLNDGLFQEQTPEAMFALHVFPLPVGSIALRKGTCLAGMQEWRVRLYAPAGDLPAVQHAVIQALSDLSTVKQPTEPDGFEAIFTQMRTGDAFSDAQFISSWESGYTSSDPWHVTALASLTDFDTRERLREQLAITIERVCAAHGAAFDLYCAFENPPLVNDAALVDAVRNIAEPLLGEQNVWKFQTPYPFAHEDFALYADYTPTAFIWLGTANHDAGIDSILHTPNYDVDERAIRLGVELMSHILLAYH